MITGVSSGIGRATAELLAQNRFRTFGTVRSDSAPIPKVKLLRIDARDPEAARAGVGAVLNRAGRIEFLVNNACVSLVGAAEETSIDEVRDLFEPNFYLSSRPFFAASSALCSRSLRSETISYLILARALGRLRALEMSSPDRQIWPYLFVIALFLRRTHVNTEYSAQSRSPRHNFTSAAQFNDLVGRVVKSTDPAISPFHNMAEKMSGKRSIYLLLPIHGRNRTRTTKGGVKAW